MGAPPAGLAYSLPGLVFASWPRLGPAGSWTRLSPQQQEKMVWALLVCLFPEDTTQLRDLLSSVSFLIKDDVLTMVGRIYQTNRKVYTLRWRSQAIHEQATKLEICDLTFSWHLAQEGSLDIPSKGCRSSESCTVHTDGGRNRRMAGCPAVGEAGLPRCQNSVGTSPSCSDAKVSLKPEAG